MFPISVPRLFWFECFRCFRCFQYMYPFCTHSLSLITCDVFRGPTSPVINWKDLFRPQHHDCSFSFPHPRPSMASAAAASAPTTTPRPHCPSTRRASQLFECQQGGCDLAGGRGRGMSVMERRAERRVGTDSRTRPSTRDRGMLLSLTPVHTRTSRI